MRVEREQVRSRAVVGTPSFGCDMHQSNVAWPREDTKSRKDQSLCSLRSFAAIVMFLSLIFLNVLTSDFSPRPPGEG